MSQDNSTNENNMFKRELTKKIVLRILDEKDGEQLISSEITKMPNSRQ